MVVLNDSCSALQVKECMIIWLQITTIIVVMDHLRRCGTRNAYMHILSIYLRYIIYILHSDQTIGADQNIGSTQNIGAHTLRWNQMRWHVLHCCCTMLWLVVCPCLCFVDPCYCRTYGVPVTVAHMVSLLLSHIWCPCLWLVPFVYSMKGVGIGGPCQHGRGHCTFWFPLWSDQLFWWDSIECHVVSITGEQAPVSYQCWSCSLVRVAMCVLVSLPPTLSPCILSGVSP